MFALCHRSAPSHQSGLAQTARHGRWSAVELDSGHLPWPARATTVSAMNVFMLARERQSRVYSTGAPPSLYNLHRRLGAPLRGRLPAGGGPGRGAGRRPQRKAATATSITPAARGASFRPALTPLIYIPTSRCSTSVR